MRNIGSIDRLPADEIKRIQGELLVATVRYAQENSPYYSKKLNDLSLSSSDIGEVASIGRLPLTDRKDIQENNWAFLAVCKEDIAEIVATTGTTGDPAFIALTHNDLDRLACNEERNFGYADAGRGDIFHLAVTCDNLFIAGIAYYRGLTQRGASVIRIGPQNLTRHLDLIRRLKPTGIVAVPSFMVHMARRMCDLGVTPEEFGLKKIVLIGDSIRDADLRTNALGNLVETAFGAACYSTYGITEAQLSFCECSEHRGLHSHPDFVLVEIVDDSGAPLPDGEVGELVLTPLQVEGMPLLRYKTGDMTFKLPGPCLCGRNSVRIGPILGRRNHKLKVKGVTLYPKAIENALLGVKGVVNYQIEAFTSDDQTDDILVRIGSHNHDNGLLPALYEALRAKVRVTPRIVVEPPEEIEKRLFEGGSRKAVVFRDRRHTQYE